jgi:hypothetical protein
MIREHFYLFECFYVPRTCNSSAHETAALGLNQSSGSEFVWEYPIPEFVSSRVAGVGMKLIERPESQVSKKKDFRWKFSIPLELNRIVIKKNFVLVLQILQLDVFIPIMRGNMEFYLKKCLFSS